MEYLPSDIINNIFENVDYNNIVKFIKTILEKNNDTPDNIKDISRYNYLNDIINYRFIDIIELYKKLKVIIFKDLTILDLTDKIFALIELVNDYEFVCLYNKYNDFTIFPKTISSNNLAKHPYFPVEINYTTWAHCKSINLGYINILIKYFKTNNQIMIDNLYFDIRDLYGCLKVYYKNHLADYTTPDTPDIIFDNNIIIKIQNTDNNLLLGNIVDYIFPNNLYIIDKILQLPSNRTYILHKLIDNFRNYLINEEYAKTHNDIENYNICNNFIKYFNLYDLKLVDNSSFGNVYRRLYNYNLINNDTNNIFNIVLTENILKKYTNEKYINFELSNLEILTKPELALFVEYELYSDKKNNNTLPIMECIIYNYYNALQLILENFYKSENDCIVPEIIAKYNNETFKLYMNYLYNFNKSYFINTGYNSKYYYCLNRFIRNYGFGKVNELAPYLYNFDTKQQYLDFINRVIIRNNSDNLLLPIITLFTKIYKNSYNVEFDDIIKCSGKTQTFIFAIGEFTNLENITDNNKKILYDYIISDMEEQYITNYDKTNFKEYIKEDIKKIYENYKYHIFMRDIEIIYEKIYRQSKLEYNVIDLVEDIIEILMFDNNLINNYTKEIFNKIDGKVINNLPPFQKQFIDNVIFANNL